MSLIFLYLLLGHQNVFSSGETRVIQPNNSKLKSFVSRYVSECITFAI